MRVSRVEVTGFEPVNIYRLKPRKINIFKRLSRFPCLVLWLAKTRKNREFVKSDLTRVYFFKTRKGF